LTAVVLELASAPVVTVPPGVTQPAKASKAASVAKRREVEDLFM
jgi:hypothetical protein